jgi:hypothetical protein
MTPADINGFAFPCEALTLVYSHTALSILDSAMGNSLKHCQLQQDPRYKAMWAWWPRWRDLERNFAQNHAQKKDVLAIPIGGYFFAVQFKAQF